MNPNFPDGLLDQDASCLKIPDDGQLWLGRSRDNSMESAKTRATTMGRLSEPLRRREAPVGRMLHQWW